MASAPVDLDQLTASSPETVARDVVAGGHGEWASAFAAAVRDAYQMTTDTDGGLGRILAVWGLTDAEAGRVFGVSRQAVAKWRATGIPSARRAAIADIAATTDLLTHYVKPDRIPGVVRRPSKAFDGLAMVDFITAGRTAELLDRTRHQLDLRRLDAA